MKAILVAFFVVTTTSAAYAKEFHSEVVYPLPAATVEKMMGNSYKEGCPTPLETLALVRVSHYDSEGEVVVGELVVASHAAGAIVGVFRELFQARFPIERMFLVDFYHGDDGRSMAANNTSAFNCRRVAGSNRWSEHSGGLAVDINPLQNPWVSGKKVDPPAGRRYAIRDGKPEPGMIMAGGVVVRAFAKIGWKWGGDWKSSKDYQHFSQSGK